MGGERVEESWWFEPNRLMSWLGINEEIKDSGYGDVSRMYVEMVGRTTYISTLYSRDVQNLMSNIGLLPLNRRRDGRIVKTR